MHNKIFFGVLVGVGVMSSTTACNDKEAITPPVQVAPAMHVIRGAALTDTIQAKLLTAIVVEVRGTNGKPKSGVVVRFDKPTPTDTARLKETTISLCNIFAQFCSGVPDATALVSDTTDAKGQLAALVRLGTITGRVVVAISAPALSLKDSAVFTVTPGNAVRVRASAPDTSLNLGTTAQLRGRTVDRFNNTRADATTVTAGPGDKITVNTTTGVVTAVEMGEQFVYVRYGNFRDSTYVRAVPAARLVAWAPSSAAVRMFNSDGSDTRTLLTNMRSTFGAFPQFDASRRNIIAHGPNGETTSFIVLDTTGSPRRDIGPSFNFRAIQAVRALPDGSLLVVSFGPEPKPYALYRVAPDNSVTQLYDLPTIRTDNSSHADFSPDGTKLAYQAYTGNLEVRELRVLNIATGVTTVVASSANAPRWSPDGTRIAFINGPATGPLSIINADGTGRVNFSTSFIYLRGVSWSPDARYLIGTSVAQGLPALRILRIADEAGVFLQLRNNGTVEEYSQPDWR